MNLSESYRKHLNEWSDDPVADYDRYCDQCDKNYAEYADEEIRRLENELEDDDCFKSWLEDNYDNQKLIDKFEETNDVSNLSDEEYEKQFTEWVNSTDYAFDVYQKYIQDQIDELDGEINDNYRVYHSDQDDYDRWRDAQED